VTVFAVVVMNTTQKAEKKTHRFEKQCDEISVPEDIDFQTILRKRTNASC